MMQPRRPDIGLRVDVGAVGEALGRIRHESRNHPPFTAVLAILTT